MATAISMSSGWSIHIRSWPSDTQRTRQVSARTRILAAVNVNGSALMHMAPDNNVSAIELRPQFFPQRNIEDFSIRSYEVGENRRTSMATIANLLQEVACNHARSAGFSVDGFATTLSMRKYGLIWVITRIHIEVDEYPQWGDRIQIDTWFQFEGKNGTRRDWRVTNTKTGKVIARATSTFALMNQQTRRLARINDDVRNEFCLYVLHPPSYVFVDDASVKKPITKMDTYEHVKDNLKPSRSDLDMNQHVNNAVYINWVLESLPQEVHSGSELHSLTLEFRCECNRDDTVTASASVELDPSSNSSEKSNYTTFTHLISLAGSRKEVSRSRTTWRKTK